MGSLCSMFDKVHVLFARLAATQRSARRARCWMKMFDRLAGAYASTARPIKITQAPVTQASSPPANDGTLFRKTKLAILLSLSFSRNVFLFTRTGKQDLLRRKIRVPVWRKGRRASVYFIPKKPDVKYTDGSQSLFIPQYQIMSMFVNVRVERVLHSVSSVIQSYPDMNMKNNSRTIGQNVSRDKILLLKLGNIREHPSSDIGPSPVFKLSISSILR